MKISTGNRIFAVLLLILSALHTTGAEVAALLDKFNEYTEAVHEEHERRMWQCAREVRRKLCKDIRRAVNEFEKGF